MKTRNVFGTIVVFAAGAAASAGPFSDWNLAVRHDLNTQSHVDGSALVGGNVSGTSVYSMHGVTASNGAGLMVGGNVSGNTQVNSGGNLVYGGTLGGTTLVNGGGSRVQQGGIGAVVDGVFAHANAYSTFLKDVASTGSLSVLDGTKGKLSSATTTTIGSNNVAVYSLSQSTLGSLSELDLNFGSADFVVINVDAGVSGAANIGMNFLGGLNQNNAGRIVWNFFNTTDLTITRNLSGMVLATGADLNLSGSGIYGTVIVDRVSTMNAEIRSRNFGGDFDIAVVPLPPAAWAGLGLLGGMLGVRAVRRR